MRVKGKHVIYSFILLVSGFLAAYSFQMTKDRNQLMDMPDDALTKDYFYREELNKTEEKNNELRDKLAQLKKEITELEEQLGEEQEALTKYIDDKRLLERLTGEVPVKGPGISVTLEDAEYVPSDNSINDYIVHDRHILKVIHELSSSGAVAIAINGQRLYKDSFLSCVGPVISVDGIKHPAPFVISAIGDPEVLSASVQAQNGVVYELVSENVEVTVQTKESIEMNTRDTVERW
ncbi:DUF881 domain-containing protein [Salirhabdus salicampi]|uniref:DUF881 domain-containing protein n=1 Tax=Salirhabdus salicampi TaxID=476102 RepID=UPI0020C2F2AF|nr:DUF881 domain-containing protein [Salirhabdus salicampi]MCP8616600.1 DUF881 domain-containing protein [Salirhabdus salicampi]